MANAIPKLKSNLDTDFLKLIAIVSMLLDHVGNTFSLSIQPFVGLGG